MNSGYPKELKRVKLCVVAYSRVGDLLIQPSHAWWPRQCNRKQPAKRAEACSPGWSEAEPGDRGIRCKPAKRATDMFPKIRPPPSSRARSLCWPHTPDSASLHPGLHAHACFAGW